MKTSVYHDYTMGSAFKRILGLLLAAVMLTGTLTPALAYVPPVAQEPAAIATTFPDGFSDDRTKYEIYPMPHDVQYLTQDEFQVTPQVNVVAETGIDTYTKAFLEELLTKYGKTFHYSAEVVEGETNFLLGVKGSGGVADSYATAHAPLKKPALFDQIDPYLLRAESDQNPNGIITIVGKDTDSAYYGVATLQMMFSSFAGKRFLPVQIEDYSNVIYRGFIEGFYGVYADPYPFRESQMRSIRDVKGNTYVFAAKGDAYHGSKWAELYPKEELAQIKHLVEVGLETKVAYTWSVHLGQGGFFRGITSKNPNDPTYRDRVEKLKAKFQQLYDVGVRGFHILNDDANSGTHEQVVMLLNEMNAWRKEKGCRPIIYCCNGYNTAWAGNGAELTALKALDPDIYLYWTGSDVNSPITQASVDWPRAKSNHYPVTWLNYPCSEHAGSVPLLGNSLYYLKNADNLQNHMGIISNPVRSQSETTKIAFFQLLSWGWNRDNYTSYGEELWEDCFKYLQPEVYSSYLTIARNISNAPKSGRIPAGDKGFPESEYIKAALLSVQKKVLSDAPLAQDAEVNSLLAELKNIALAVDDFCANCKNATLIQQLKPWLNSLKAIAQSGAGGLEAAIAMQKGDFDSAWTGLSIAGTGLSAWDASVPDQRGGGSKRIQPFAAAVTAYISAKLTPILLPDAVSAAVSFYGKIGGTEQPADAESAKMLDGNPATYASYAVNQVQDDYYGVDLGKVTKVTGISILQGKPNSDPNYYHNATLEYSSDGTVWNTLVQKVDSASIRTGTLDLRARYLRLRLLSTGTTDPAKADYHTYVREFTVLTGAPADADTLVYTNVPALKSTVAAQDGSDFTLNAAGSVTLEKGEYLGLKLPEITGVSAIVTGAVLPEGLTLQYSASGVVWTDGAPAVPDSVRYVRMVNLTDSAVTGSLPALTVTMNQPPFHPTLLDTSAGQAFKNDQAKVFDGDHGTLAYDKSNQQVGNYYTFDFGAKQPIYDLKFYSGENNDYIYNMDISLATSPDGPWTKVGIIDEDHPMVIEPPRRVFTCNANGMEARYLKLEVTKLPPKAQWLMLYEIEVNKDHALETSLGAFSGTPLGKFEALLDQNLATSFTPGTIAGKGGYVQYLISEHNAVKSLRILQNPKACSNAAVTVQTADGAWHDLGKLDAGSKQFNTAGLGNLTALRLNWVKGTTPAIAEIVLQGAPNQDQDPGVDPLSLPNLYRAPAVEPVTVNYGTPLTRAGLPTRLTVPLSSGANATLAVRWKSADYAADKAGDYACSGTFTMPAGIVNSAGLTLSATVTVKADAGSAQEPITGNLALGKAVAVSDVEIKSEVGAHAVDGTTGTRWSAWPLMKEKLDKNTENQIKDVEWIVVDLDKAQGGTDLGGTNTIDKVTLTATANKAWGTKYAVQTSDDNITWKTVKECVWEASDNTGVVQENVLDAPVTGRYVKILFHEMNIKAEQANSVSIAELDIHGTKSFDVPQGTPENLALKHPATVSGYEPNGPANNAAAAVDGIGNDDSINARWSSNYMKGSGLVQGVQTPAWIVVDLGADVGTITEVKALYHAKVWPTNYSIQFAESYTDTPENNAENAAIWTTVKTITRGNGDTKDITDTAAEFTAPVPSGVRYVRLYFRTLNTNAAGHSVGLRELTVTGTRALPAEDPNIVSVADTTDSAVMGTAFADLALPDTVVVTLADGTKSALPVTWAEGSYDSAAAADYTLTGTVNPAGSGITNTDNVTAKLILTVAAEPKVVSVTVSPAVLNADLGTTADALKLLLPKQVAAALDNGLGAVCGVTWDTTGYSGDVIQTYPLTGTLTLPGGITNTDSIGAAISVTVVDRTAPTAPGDLTAGAITATGATLAWTASTDNSGSIAGYSVTVNGAIQSTAENTLTLTGLTSHTVYNVTVTAADGAGNTSDAANCTFTTLSATYDTDIAAVAPLTLTVLLGTPLAQVPLPAEVTVSLTSGAKAVLPVTWDTAAYNGTVAGDYVMTGTLTLKDGHTNGLSITPEITVTVRPAPDVQAPVSPTTYTVTAAAAKGGTVTPEQAKIVKGGSKVFTITPQQGYTLKELLVNGISVPLSALAGPNAAGAYTYELAKVAKDTTLKVTFTPKMTDADFAAFTDLPGHWAVAAIRAMLEQGLMTGTDAKTFAPDDETSRAMVVMVLYRLAGAPSISAGAPFTDTSGDAWYAKGVTWASENKIVSGVGGSFFVPDGAVTRQDLVSVLYRYALRSGKITAVDTKVLAAFSDCDQVAPWATEAVAWAVEQGLLTGKQGNTLAPTAEASRAELATLIQRFAAMY